MERTKRRDTRYRVQLPAIMTLGKTSTPMVTEDISFRGLFLRTDSPPGLRQLVRVEIRLPLGTSFKALAMAVFVLPPNHESGRAPGVGVQFYGLSKQESSVWETYVNTLGRHNPDAEDFPLRPMPVPEPEPIRRQFKRYSARLRVRPKNLDALINLYTRDVSRGGMFVRTEMEVKVGDIIQLEIKHPETSAEFPVSCRVKHMRSASPGERGVGVEFGDMDEARREEFYEFIHSAIPVVEVDGNVIEIDE